jgi:hypothetical protein
MALVVPAAKLPATAPAANMAIQSKPRCILLTPHPLLVLNQLAATDAAQDSSQSELKYGLTMEIFEAALGVSGTLRIVGRGGFERGAGGAP